MIFYDLKSQFKNIRRESDFFLGVQQYHARENRLHRGDPEEREGLAAKTLVLWYQERRQNTPDLGQKQKK